MAQGLQDLLRNELAGVIAEAETDVIEGLVRDYRAGKLTADLLFSRIGEIAGMRRLADKVDQGIRMANRSAKKDIPSME